MKKTIMATCSLLIVTAVILAIRYSVSVAIELVFWVVLSTLIGYLILTGLVNIRFAKKRRLKEIWALSLTIAIAIAIMVPNVSLTMFKWEIKPVEQNFIETSLHAKRYSDGIELHYGGKLDKIKAERNTILKKWGRFISSGDWHTEERTGPVLRYTTDWNPTYWWFHND